MKNNFTYFKFSIVIELLIFVAVNINAQNPCPTYNDLLDKGWGHTIVLQHIPEHGNADEFAATDSNPFIIKAGNYPPVKSFPMIPYAGCSASTFYYFSFDTDLQIGPINYRLPKQEENIVKTYRVDQNGNYLSGYRMIVYPPEGSGGGDLPIPDFVMKYNGTYHDVAWNINLYPWSNFVYNQVSYIPQGLTVNILGVNALNYNSSSEFIADINGGGGEYAITLVFKNKSYW
ncbi:MAG: hypothetical protein MZV64_54230 [Ignavibacteriales bacterium]|nr:hypothetical protein [Ignavibacteriales bacterium]